MIHKTVRTTFCAALCAALCAQGVLARQQPAPAPAAPPTAAEQPEARKADLSREFARLFPDTTSLYIEAPHLASLVAVIGGSDSLLETANTFLTRGAKAAEKEGAASETPAPARKPDPGLSAKELNTLLDASVAVGVIGNTDGMVGSFMNPSMTNTAVVLHMNSAEGVAILRDRVFARFGKPINVNKVRGVEIARLAQFSYVISGRAVLVGRDDIVDAVVATAAASSSDVRRLGDDPGFASAAAKHAGGQEQVFAFVSGRSIAATIGMFVGVQPPRTDGTKAKESPTEAAIRSFAGLEALLGLGIGARLEGNDIKVRYDFELDRSRSGLITAVADPPAIEFRAAWRLPADTDRLTVFSLDATRIYDLLDQAFGPIPPTSPGARTFATEVADIEQTIGVSLRGELLPALGTEFAFSGTLETMFGGTPPSAEGAPRPITVVTFDVRNPEVARKIASKILTLKPDMPAIEPIEYKGAELWDVPGDTAFALGKDFGIIGSGQDIRRCLDAQAAGTVLAKTPEYAAQAGTWAGDTLYGTFESAAAHEAAERMEAKRRESMRQAVGDNPETLEMMNVWSAIPTMFPSAVFRDGSGVHWEASVPVAPLAGVASYVFKQVLRDAGPTREPENDPNDQMLSVLYTIASAEANFRSEKDRFATVEELISEGRLTQSAIEDDVKRAGYRIQVTPEGTGTGARFTVSATPIEYGKPGKLSFFIDESFIIRAADREGAPASASDAPFTYGGDGPVGVLEPAAVEEEYAPPPEIATPAVDVETAPDE